MKLSLTVLKNTPRNRFIVPTRVQLTEFTREVNTNSKNTFSKTTPPNYSMIMVIWCCDFTSITKGEVFLHETIELDHAYEAFDLNDSLVDQLTALSFRKENWNPFGDNKNNYYMYLTYRIKNGKITEIIP